MRFWDARAGKLTHSVTTSGENINLAWNHDGSQVAVGNKEDVISFIDTRTYKLLAKTKFPNEVNEFAWSHGGQLFFVTTGAGTVEISSYPELKPLRTLQGHTSPVYCLAFSDRYVACGSADALVSLWSLDELVCLKTFSSLEWPVRTLSFSHCGTYLAAASEDAVIDVSNVETGERAVAIQCNFAMNTVSWNPKKLLLAYAGTTTAAARVSLVSLTAATAQATKRTARARTTPALCMSGALQRSEPTQRLNNNERNEKKKSGRRNCSRGDGPHPRVPIVDCVARTPRVLTIICSRPRGATAASSS